MSVGADEPNYWYRIAAGVEGKNGEECRELLQAVWKESPDKVRSAEEELRNESKSLKFISHFENGQGNAYRLSHMATVTPKGIGAKNKGSKRTVTTPDALAHVQRAVRTKKGRSTAVYRRNVRKLGECIARKLADEVLEESVETPQLLRDLKLRSSNPTTPVAFSNIARDVLGEKEGTPGTIIRMKRAELERRARIVTPEVLTRATCQGAVEKNDAYVSRFLRNLETAARNDSNDESGRNQHEKQQHGANDDVDKRASDAFAVLPRRVMFFDDVDDSEEEQEGEDVWWHRA